MNSMSEEVDHQRESSRSAVSSLKSGKRGREDDQDQEMGTTSRDESLHDTSLPTSAVENTSDLPETSVNIESSGAGESVGHEIGMDFGIPHELSHVESFAESSV
jgi:hypothetical protein